ncbi:MAG: hypothetical protein JWN07_478 [Hyphomicrobiales bacterium]|jgi:hypothetical protein|nr:hypothetical protein [Hyphomicrobiales bacterium]
MKAAPLALACALLGATALASASFAQTPPGAAQTPSAQSPAEASPSTSSPDAAARTGTPEQRDWRDQMGRDGGWSRSRDTYESRDSSRGMRQSYADDDDDDDDDMPPARGYGGGRDERGPQQADRGGDEGQGHGPHGMKKMDPEMMRMHMRLMGGNQRGAHLKLKRGDAGLDVHCPGNENIAACVEAVGKLMDRLQAMPQTPR